MSDDDKKDKNGIIEPEISVVTGELSMIAQDKAQIDVQIATAKQFPRSVQQAINDATTLATQDEETAQSMFYVVPRSGKKIEGPSARLAEVMAYSWGNLRAQAKVVDEGRTHVVAVGTCFDLEKNVAIQVEVKRRITDKHGKRYNADMIAVTSNAAISIALRNAVFKVIPQTFVNQIYKKARSASIGQAGTMAQKRQKALETLDKMGMDKDIVFKFLGVKGQQDIGEDAIITLWGTITALKEGDTTIEKLLDKDKGPTDGVAKINESIKAKAAETESSVSEKELKALQERSEMDHKLILSKMDQLLGSEVDAFLKKHKAAMVDFLPEHRQIIEDRAEAIKNE